MVRQMSWIASAWLILQKGSVTWGQNLMFQKTESIALTAAERFPSQHLENTKWSFSTHLQTNGHQMQVRIWDTFG